MFDRENHAMRVPNQKSTIKNRTSPESEGTTMHVCSVHQELELVAGDLSDYRLLAPYHYRDNRPGAVKAVYTMRPKPSLGTLGRRPAGVIVYTMPNPRIELRTLATNGAFSGLDRQTELELLNRHVRCIARVIVEPRFRGIGLAVRLVRETMPLLAVPIIEALGVMPRVNPFLERAGLMPYAPRVPVAHVELLEALGAVGIAEDDLIDPQAVQAKLGRLARPAGEFIETRIQRFLKSHGSRRTMLPGIERTRYILGKLTHRPAYYIWFNPDKNTTWPCGPELKAKKDENRRLDNGDYEDQADSIGQVGAASGQPEPDEPDELRQAGSEHRTNRPV
jgi:hypothetical protein